MQNLFAFKKYNLLYLMFLWGWGFALRAIKKNLYSLVYRMNNLNYIYKVFN